MSISDLVRKMAAAGAPPEAIALAVEAIEAEQAKDAERREKRAAQKRKERAISDATVARLSPDNDATVAPVSQTVAADSDAYKDNRADARGFPVGISNEIPKLDTPDLKIVPPAEETARSARSILFERFCQAYPKRTNRKAASAKFDAALRAGVDGERIIAAAIRYAEACRRAGTEKQFIPAPDVWLNKGKYDDDDLPETNSRAGPPPRRRFCATERLALGILSDADEDEFNRNYANRYEPQNDRSDPPAYDGPTIDLSATSADEPRNRDEACRSDEPPRGSEPFEEADLWGPRTAYGGHR